HDAGGERLPGEVENVAVGLAEPGGGAGARADESDLQGAVGAAAALAALAGGEQRRGYGAEAGSDKHLPSSDCLHAASRLRVRGASGPKRRRRRAVRQHSVRTSGTHGRTVSYDAAMPEETRA